MTDPKAPTTPGFEFTPPRYDEVAAEGFKKLDEMAVGAAPSGAKCKHECGIEGEHSVCVCATCGVEFRKNPEAGAPSGARTAQQFYDSRGTLMFMVDEQTQAAIFRFAEAYAARQVAELTEKLKDCGGENCMGHRLEHHLNWVTEQRLDVERKRAEQAESQVAELTKERDQIQKELWRVNGKYSDLVHMPANALSLQHEAEIKAQEQTIRERDQTIADLAAWLRRHLSTNVISRSIGRGGHDGDGNSWAAVAIPDWDVRQKLDALASDTKTGPEK